MMYDDDDDDDGFCIFLIVLVKKTGFLGGVSTKQALLQFNPKLPHSQWRFSRMQRRGARLNCDTRKTPREALRAHDAASEGNIQWLHALFDAGCDVDMSDKKIK